MMNLKLQGQSFVFQISIMMSKAQIDLRHSSIFMVKFLPLITRKLQTGSQFPDKRSLDILHLPNSLPHSMLRTRGRAESVVRREDCSLV